MGWPLGKLDVVSWLCWGSKHPRMASSMAGMSLIVSSESTSYYWSWLISCRSIATGNGYIVVTEPGDICMCDTWPQSWASVWHQSSCAVPWPRLSGSTILAAKAGCLLVPRALTYEPLNFLFTFFDMSTSKKMSLLPFHILGIKDFLYMMIKRIENTVNVIVVTTRGTLNVRCMREHLLYAISIFQLLGRVRSHIRMLVGS